MARSLPSRPVLPGTTACICWRQPDSEPAKKPIRKLAPQRRPHAPRPDWRSVGNGHQEQGTSRHYAPGRPPYPNQHVVVALQVSSYRGRIHPLGPVVRAGLPATAITAAYRQAVAANAT
jgi:hypothetical protein